MHSTSAAAKTVSQQQQRLYHSSSRDSTTSAAGTLPQEQQALYHRSSRHSTSAAVYYSSNMQQQVLSVAATCSSKDSLGSSKDSITAAADTLSQLCAFLFLKGECAKYSNITIFDRSYRGPQENMHHFVAFSRSFPGRKRIFMKFWKISSKGPQENVRNSKNMKKRYFFDRGPQENLPPHSLPLSYFLKIDNFWR